MAQNFIITREQYLQLKKTWSETKYHSAGEHIIYNILRSKSPSLGFVERKRNIQGNSSWHAFKTAKDEAIRGFYRNRIFAHVSQIECETKFKQRFGIDIPADLYELLKAATV